MDSSYIHYGAIEKIEDLEEKIPRDSDEAKEAATSYLKQEWRKILEKYVLGRGVLSISDFFKNFNPLFNLILGIEYSLSWFFFLSLIGWIVVFLIVYFLVRSFFIPDNFIDFGIGAIIPILAAQFGIFENITGYISEYLQSNLRIILFLVTIGFLLFIYIYFMRSLEKYTRKTMRKEARDQKAYELRLQRRLKRRRI